MKRIKTAVVISDKMNKTRIVRVEWTIRSPLYGKFVKRNTKYYVHDEKNSTHVGDKVKIIETRPISNKKRWKIYKETKKEL
ncbi:MAG: 30S ribosomal protein S17 [Elusimicrobia bacterium RIFOXYC2_FULL_34_12]|nr:MAG: 30S ribosomal protein S17 [Elusimicrobia bacterium RIFOXYC2_FULL_34_12]OGS38580.1 MAG: 30S ribosomal protein S17 [Elusimicrobia bacterium RIFOXYD2_FULL_34_30]